MIGCSSSEDEASRKKKTSKKPDEVVEEVKSDERSIPKRVGLIEGIMRENRQAQQKIKNADSAGFSIEAMLDSLRDEVANDPTLQ